MFKEDNNLMEIIIPNYHFREVKPAVSAVEILLKGPETKNSSLHLIKSKVLMTDIYLKKIFHFFFG